LHATIKNEDTLNSNKVVCIIRPEHIKILSESAPKPANYFEATIDNYSYLGKQIRLWVKLNPSGDILFVDIFAEELDEVRRGKPLTVGFDSMHTICFEGN
jgi:ABC-type Fe3+/spermidine/putrescine transport system ATPase subunit